MPSLTVVALEAARRLVRGERVPCCGTKKRLYPRAEVPWQAQKACHKQCALARKSRLLAGRTPALDLSSWETPAEKSFFSVQESGGGGLGFKSVVPRLNRED
ncbi:hypothetical protein NDU88_003722 [Pleurodeles waltl]|uniref:Uncharacterized protein n=1 Tax=Pleurodeles waltl TaxID=8319 RepID=A0AAV7TQD9_PLEWA|nr:hypothetical protein NDU88_003722 [Pleurodeles waltl]